MATAYLLTKTAHLVFVIAWMAALFYLPRIAGASPASTMFSRIRGR